MKLTKISTAIILILLTVTLSAQKRGKQTVVLNNGSRLTGFVLIDSSDYLKMRITTPQLITLSKSEVSMISPAQKTEKPAIDRNGYSIRISVSALTGRNDEGNIGSMSIHLSNSYRFGNRISVGFGTGFEELDVSVMPVYADLRYDPLKSRFSPFIWMKSGWSFAFGELDYGQYYYYGFPKSQGGFMFNTGTGVELASWRRNAVNIGIGYRFQKITCKYDNSQIEEIMNEVVTCYNRFEVQFGFIFR